MFIALRAHPLFYGVMGIIIGIISAEYCTPFFLSIAVISLMLIMRYVPCTFLIIFLGMSTGMLRLGFTHYLHKKALQELLHYAPASSCKARVIDYGYKDGVYHRYHLTMQLLSINDQPVKWAKWYTIVLYSSVAFKCKIGDTIALKNLSLVLPKDISFQRWLLKAGALATCYQKSFDIEFLYRPVVSIKRFIFEQRALLWLRIKRSMPIKTYTLFASLFGGSKEVNKQAMQHNKMLFRRWGIAHQLARSGMHVSFFISLLMMGLCVLPLGLKLRSAVLMGLIILYSLLSWPSVSFNRALIMALIDQVLRILGKQKNSLHVWSLTAALMLLYNPLYLFFIDFQLSFGFSLLLIWMAQLNYLEKRGL